MKYGQELRQRSAPEWVYHNISYDNVKSLIKENTTPGKGKAVSVPGQGNEVESAFEEQLYHVFKEQNEHITLFVKTKTGEINRRLELITSQLQRLQSYDGVPISRRRLHLAAKVEQDAVTVGEEIQSLSRFISANKLAFKKLTKKYRKWTGSDILSERVKNRILGQPDSFAQVDVTPYLDRWIELLALIRASKSGQARPQSLRDVYASSPSTSGQIPKGETRTSSTEVADQLRAATNSGSDLEYDSALASTSLGGAGRKAIYWVHPEQLIELQVLLLQHLRPLRPGSSSRAESASSSPNMTRRSSRIGSPIDGQGNTGLLILDNLDDYARRQSQSPVSATEGHVRQTAATAAVHVRWTADEGTLIDLNKKGDKASDTAKHLWMPKRYLGRFLDTTEKRESWTKVSEQPTPVKAGSGIERNLDLQQLKSVRDWLGAHTAVKPMVSVTSHRARFSDLTENSGMGQWCMIDTDICMKRASLPDAKDNKEWPTKSPGECVRFPYAVVEIRQEGKIAQDLVELLDQSHLTERVRGFSLAAHAVWSVLKPSNMSSPFWIPALSRDIRKAPEAPPKRQPRKGSVQTSTSDSRRNSTQPITSTATSTTQEGNSSGNNTNTSAMAASSSTLPTSIDQRPAPIRSNTKRKMKVPSRDAAPLNNTTQATGERYWNEYDHPEDGSGDENAFYIYVDPQAPVEYPGKTVLNFIGRKVQMIVGGKVHQSSYMSEQERALLNHPHGTPTTGASEDTDSDTDSTDSALWNASNAKGWYESFKTRKARREGRNGSVISTSTTTTRTNTYGTLPLLPPPAIATTTPPLAKITPVPGSLTGFRLPDVCLAASLVILVILSFLVMVGRRRARGEVDAGIIFGVSMVLLFLAIGVGAFWREVSLGRKTGRQTALGMWRWTMAGFVVVMECVGSGLFLAWVLTGA